MTNGIASAETRAVDRSGVDTPAAIRHLRRADPKLGPVIERAARPQLGAQRSTTVFAALARAIVYQQISGKAAGTIYGRVCALYPGRRRGLTARAVLATADATLRAAGLSSNKLLSLKDLAAHVAARRIPGPRRLERMEDEAIIEALTQVRGIGRWTAEMFLLFHLGRPDVLAVDDLGLRQGHAFVVGGAGETSREALLAYGERWRPYRSVASWYLWRAVELARAGQFEQIRYPRHGEESCT